MANNVMNLMHIEGGTDEDLAKFEKDIANEKGELDLNKLFPCPEELNTVQSPLCIVTQAERDAVIAKHEEQVKSNPSLAKLSVGFPITQEMHDDFVAKYGFADWYSWRIANWGTKWGLYDCERCDNNEIAYQTAWSPASEFWQNVSKSYPSIVFYHEYGEAGCCFAGFERIQNGSIIESSDPEWESPEANEICDRVGCPYGGDDDEDEDESED
jgi:hypothetical protein